MITRATNVFLVLRIVRCTVNKKKKRIVLGR